MTVGVNSAILDNGNVPAGYHFVLKVIFRQYVSNSDEDRLVKLADVYTKTSMTPANFMTALKDSLDKNLVAEESATATTLVTRTVSSNTLVLTENYMPWKRGKMSVGKLPFEVVAEPVEIDGVEQESVVSNYTFDSIGEHTVKYKLIDSRKVNRGCFSSCKNIISVVIPHKVTTIEYTAFSQCENLFLREV